MKSFTCWREAGGNSTSDLGGHDRLDLDLSTKPKSFSYVVDHEVHDGFGHQVSDALVDDSHVGVHQVSNGLHLTFQLGIHGEVVRRGRGLALNL